jgi:DNA polymerase I-like protein with 3'-5' exonuclease and polymerase domains
VKVQEIRSGNKLIATDYSQIEIRVIAQIGGDQRTIDACRKGQNSHWLTVSIFLKGWRIGKL